MKYKILIILFLSRTLIADVDEYVLNINENLKNGKFQDAVEIFNKAILEHDASSELYYVGSQISIKMDNLDQANKHLVKAIGLDPKNKDYRNDQEKLAELKDLLNRARKTFDSGLINDAIIEYEKLTIKYPQHAIVFYNLGLIYRASEEYSLAVKNYQNAQHLNPFEVKYSLAVKAIAQMHAKEGDLEYRRQEFDFAIEKYQKAIAYYSEYTTAIFKLARTYYKLKDFINAQFYIEQGLSIDPQQEQSEKMLGDIYRNSDNIEQARTHYINAIKINENYFQAFYSLGSLYLSIGRLNEAHDVLNNAILIAPTYAKAYGALGTVEQELGNINKAIQNYSKAIELDSKTYDIHYRLSNAYNINKQFVDAKYSAKNSLNIKRNYAPAYFELGMAEKSLGNRVAAKDAFEKAKKDRNWRKSAQFELELLSKGL